MKEEKIYVTEDEFNIQFEKSCTEKQNLELIN
jgi:hypothetical protein